MKKNRRHTGCNKRNVKRTILSVLLPFLLLSPLANAGTVQLPETGQTTCYNSFGSAINCTSTGQDGEIRDGVGWPFPRFTNPDGSFPINGDAILDQLTGLMWLRTANCIKIHYPAFDNDGVPGDGMVTWQHALDFARGINNTAGTPGTDYFPLCGAGYSDWRLANLNELASLINLGAPWPAGPGGWLSSQGFTDGPWGIETAAFYWSSSTCAHQTDNAWAVNMQLGWMGYAFLPPQDKSLAHYVWVVRGTTSGPSQLSQTGQTDCYDSSGTNIDCAGTGQDGELQAGVAWPDPRYSDNGDGTVIDNLTGIMWLQDGNCFGALTWQDSLDAISNFNFNPDPYNCENYTATYTDWQMPNRVQLASTMDLTRYDMVWDEWLPFMNMRGTGYWSSTTYQVTPSTAWSMHIEFGPHFLSYNKSDTSISTWPMRRGLSVVPGNHDFGTVTVGESAQMTFMLLNSGDADIVLGAITSDDASQFIPSSCADLILSPMEDCTITVDFMPDSTGLKEATISIPSSEPDNPLVMLSLTGTGTRTISGTISYNGSQTGAIHVAAFTSPITCSGPNTDADEPVAHEILTSLGEYTLSGLDDGTYYIVSVITACGLDCDIQYSDPWGVYDKCGNVTAVQISNNDVTGVDIELEDGTCLDRNPFYDQERYYGLQVTGNATGTIDFVRDSETVWYAGFDVPGDGGGRYSGVEVVMPYSGHAPPLKYETPEVGQTWSGAGTSIVGTNVYPVNSTAVVTSISETVSVSSGTFHDCARVEGSLYYPSGYESGYTYPVTDERWFCPGIGPVKIIITENDNSSYTGELTSYQNIPVNGGVYFPLGLNYSWTFTLNNGRSATWVVKHVDSDRDGILDDGDGSGDPADNPCTGGNTTDCDDNSLNTPNADQADMDGDLVGDACDNCREVANPDQNDANAHEDDNTSVAGIQHYGNACDPDFDNDGICSILDLAIWRRHVGETVPPAPDDVDVNGDGVIWLQDLAVWRRCYGGRPGPGIGD